MYTLSTAFCGNTGGQYNFIKRGLRILQMTRNKLPADLLYRSLFILKIPSDLIRPRSYVYLYAFESVISSCLQKDNESKDILYNIRGVIETIATSPIL